MRHAVLVHAERASKPEPELEPALEQASERASESEKEREREKESQHESRRAAEFQRSPLHKDSLESAQTRCGALDCVASRKHRHLRPSESLSSLHSLHSHTLWQSNVDANAQAKAHADAGEQQQQQQRRRQQQKQQQQQQQRRSLSASSLSRSLTRSLTHSLACSLACSLGPANLRLAGLSVAPHTHHKRPTSPSPTFANTSTSRSTLHYTTPSPIHLASQPASQSANQPAGWLRCRLVGRPVVMSCGRPSDLPTHRSPAEPQNVKPRTCRRQDGQFAATRSKPGLVLY